MTKQEENIERRYTYEERLAILGFYDVPPQWAHNLAVAEASDHIAALKLQETKDAIAPLLALRESL